MAQHVLDLDQQSPVKVVKKSKSKPAKSASTAGQDKYAVKPQAGVWSTKRKVMLGSGLASLLVALALGAIWWTQSNAPAVITNLDPKPQPTPTPILPDQPNPLNGILYTKEQAQAWANRRPLAVMVENHLEARPQSGLDQAEILYEAMAEGGITRMMAVYLHNQPSKIGPVRSSRLHFVSWASEYEALYAHWGGSAESLDYLRNHSNPRNIDQFYNGGAFYRDFSGGRTAVHAGFTSTEALRGIAQQRGWEQLPTFRSWQFKDDAETAQRPAQQTVDLSFLGNSNYTASFAYQPKTNTYLRSTGGRPHLDASGKQLEAKTIILQFQSLRSFNDASGNPAVDLTTLGSGKSVVIQDGQATSGTWTKSAHATRTLFTDSQGKEVPLNRGTIWIISVPNGSGYSY